MDLASLARSIRLLLISLVGVAAVAHAQACGVDDGLSSFVDDDAGRPIDRGDALPFGNDAEPSLGSLRLAHLAPELGTVDFCYAALTGAFEGPILRGGGADPDASTDAAEAGDADASTDAAADASDAAAPGVAYGTVTKYLTLQATGTIKLAIVRAGATSCTNRLVEGNVTVDPGKLTTVALFGAPSADLDAGDGGDAADGGDPGAPSIVAFVDDRGTKSDRARVRMIHASTAGKLVVRAGPTLVTDDLQPRKAGAASQTVPVDELGFATITPVAPPASLEIDPSGWKSAPVDLDLRGDSLHTGFVLDGPDGGFDVVWCADRTTTAELTACIRVR